MLVTINNFEVDLSKPIDISIPLSNTDANPIAWYLDKPEIKPVVFGDWTGSVKEGASTNFNTIVFNPHGHGTHTECLGHITKEFYSINQCLKQFFYFAKLVSVEPEVQGEDFVIGKNQLEVLLRGEVVGALIIRTLPNLETKQHQNYSNSNPPYLSEEAAIFIRESGIQHLLIDLPSVDKEHDEGKLLAHKAFWNVKDVSNLNADARLNCTITEMIFVPDNVPDGNYLLNLQIASFENDASPSKPILYKI
ncbi:Kynurenine formamidase [Flavobacterium glycines]|uniref:Arylformamidase n=1 Tax=Flavobacterium glycines TaxID=551990 RepID=A0A1B9DQ18_9FLAO|nr:cyclase family protein [Flavobacterium glycines]OCB71784.1 metal-dependent hydrolase [Flavobacterium glycines]GEL10771.1 arylformamidase [Flavobacterium glycines]SDI55007.1 Kynurenine formamidase [Flavobacterium glycines]